MTTLLTFSCALCRCITTPPPDGSPLTAHCYTSLLNRSACVQESFRRCCCGTAVEASQCSSAAVRCDERAGQLPCTQLLPAVYHRRASIARISFHVLPIMFELIVASFAAALLASSSAAPASLAAYRCPRLGSPALATRGGTASRHRRRRKTGRKKESKSAAG